LSYPGPRSVTVNKQKLQGTNDDQTAITNSTIFSCPWIMLGLPGPV